MRRRAVSWRVRGGAAPRRGEAPQQGAQPGGRRRLGEGLVDEGREVGLEVPGGGGVVRLAIGGRASERSKDVRELARGLETPVRVLLEALQDDRVEGGGQVG